jgi:Ca2+-transporting ATPase
MSVSARRSADVVFDHRLEPMVRVHHAINGRTRLRLDPLRGRPDLLGALARRVAARHGVSSAQENPWSGALLIEHDPALSSDAVAALVRRIWRRGLSSPAAPAPSEPQGPWHAMSGDAVAAAFASKRGLSDVEANERLHRIGENRLAEPPPPSPLRVLAKQFVSVPVALLGGSALLSLATGGLIEAALTVGVICINAGIGASTESWTANLIRRLARQSDPDAAVLRHGVETCVPTSRVAPGDWIVLRTGMAVPADARLLHAQALHVDESSLTGESFPVEKSADAIVAEAASLAARKTMVYRGSVVTNGAGLAIVAATGAATEIGHVRRLLETAQSPKPPMERALDKLGVRLTIVCLGASALLVVLLRLRGAPWTGVVKSAAALAVSAIPEGLPALAASTKAMAARAMSREGVYVRNVNVVETAANIDVLCLDKTGTLTQNRMQAAVVHTLSSRYDLSEGVRAPRGVRLVAQHAALCNDAELGDAEAPSAGSGTERALLHLAVAAGLDLDSLAAAYPRTGALLRSEQRLYMVTEHQWGDTRFLTVKGAPHQVLSLCTKVHVAGGARVLSEDQRASIMAQNNAVAGEGLRVLGVARGPGSLEQGEPRELEWLGLIGLRDPLRPGAAQTVQTLQRAGLRTLILTGDQAATAHRLADDLGFSNDGSLDVVDAGTLRGLSPKALAEAVRTSEVFARVSPSDKLDIIRALQRQGHVVAMTGDGVNDGPALRAADVGIAMGKSGADVARDVADIVIADDDLTTLTRALARGRTADENLRRAVRFLLATNASEVALLLAEGLHGPEALETPAQLLWLNLMTDVFPALGLAMARPAPDVLERPPRSVAQEPFGRRELGSIAADALRIATPAMITHLIGTARHGAGARTRGLTFLALASHQLAHALRLRPGRPASELLDRSIEMGVATSYLLLVAPFAMAPLRRVLRISPPRPLEAAMIVGLSLAPLAMRLLSGSRRASGRPVFRQPAPG